MALEVLCRKRGLGKVIRKKAIWIPPENPDILRLSGICPYFNSGWDEATLLPRMVYREDFLEMPRVFPFGTSKIETGWPAQMVSATNGTTGIYSVGAIMLNPGWGTHTVTVRLQDSGWTHSGDTPQPCDFYAVFLRFVAVLSFEEEFLASAEMESSEWNAFCSATEKMEALRTKSTTAPDEGAGPFFTSTNDAEALSDGFSQEIALGEKPPEWERLDDVAIFVNMVWSHTTHYDEDSISVVFGLNGQETEIVATRALGTLGGYGPWYPDI